MGIAWISMKELSLAYSTTLGKVEYKFEKKVLKYDLGQKFVSYE